MTRLKDRITATKQGNLTWHQERAILETTEMICDVMDSQGITRSELANRLGKTKGYITQLLDGSTNMTLRTVSDVFTVLGCEFHPSCTGIDEQHDTITFQIDLPSDPLGATFVQTHSYP